MPCLTMARAVCLTTPTGRTLQARPRALRSAAVPRRAMRGVQCFKEPEKPPAVPSTGAKPRPKKPKKVDQVPLVVEQLEAKNKVMVAAIAPAVRIGIGEEFGFDVGTNVERQLVTGLKEVGFDFVYDVDFAADLTIMEEGTELLLRLADNLKGKADAKPLPMFTSCCPGWIEEVEKKHEEIIPNISSCKSPQMMLGAVIKNYWAQKKGVKPEDVCFVSVMPCVRKQGESDRPQNITLLEGRDVDHVLTTVELAKVMKEKGVDLQGLEEADFDKMLGASSGAAQLFGTTGGVMEAAVRTVFQLVTGDVLPRMEFDPVRGLDGVKEATLSLKPLPGSLLATGDGEQEPLEVKIAVANGLGNAKQLVQDVKDGVSPYHFIEVMACPGGCVNGAGQPRSKDREIAKKRQQGMYTVDERRAIRMSHNNPEVTALYESFLEEPNSHVAHELLHTYYKKIEK